MKENEELAIKIKNLTQEILYISGILSKYKTIEANLDIKIKNETDKERDVQNLIKYQNTRMEYLMGKHWEEIREENRKNKSETQNLFYNLKSYFNTELGNSVGVDGWQFYLLSYSFFSFLYSYSKDLYSNNKDWIIKHTDESKAQQSEFGSRDRGKLINRTARDNFSVIFQDVEKNNKTESEVEK